MTNIKELMKDKGFRGFSFHELEDGEYLVFAIRRGSFECLNNFTFTSGNQIYVKVVKGHLVDIRFGSADDDGEAISRRAEKKLKRLIYREIF